MNIPQALSFNAEPMFPHPIREYPLRVGDRVKFRNNVGRGNQGLIDDIVSKIGNGPFDLLQLGTRKNKIRNRQGIEAWVSRFFLIPEDADSGE